jgi:type II secretory ATPase GspE/PulE/Tfp pilus assembly ATPase PilB-like protein
VESYEISKEELSKKLPPDVLEDFTKDREKITLYRGQGCKFCSRTGYVGRTGIYEGLEVSDEIRELIVKKASAKAIKKKAVELGMTTMFDDARENVLEGVTTLEEMMRVVKKS